MTFSEQHFATPSPRPLRTPPRMYKFLSVFLLSALFALTSATKAVVNEKEGLQPSSPKLRGAGENRLRSHRGLAYCYENCCSKSCCGQFSGWDYMSCRQCTTGADEDQCI
eukprot:CAMPEP_0197442458 /NCGR_PEP_ID=MMETSP1175-20131217/8472_1 /TAXON_ID=1003142 /ORGANISM="Triceratium dubium, Strain CCMP147" /LENGTH=109 /DNA_ID=CAMNT_0042972937 /DNA_START=43 /DNA_END=372 /DNA_ORIENTATION=+